MARERGFLLLTSQLGSPQRNPLTNSQMRNLAARVTAASRENPEQQLEISHLTALGYGNEMARRIVELLSEEDLLDAYLRRGQQRGCFPITLGTELYPAMIRKLLGLDSPGSLWFKGEVSLLDNRKISLVGSRKLLDSNRKFAREVGRQAAQQGYTLVSGNAVGADREAQNSCLASGGSVISVVADELNAHEPVPGMLYLSENGYDLPFSSPRALSRNRIIHCLGEKTFVAQCALEKGGTWNGTMQNLRHLWSPVFCYDDGTEAMDRLEGLGAEPIGMSRLNDISELQNHTVSFFDL